MPASLAREHGGPFSFLSPKPEALIVSVCWLPQQRTEALGLLLAAICVATPTLQQRLLALQSGRTTGDGTKLAGATRLFKLLPTLADGAKQVRFRGHV